MDSLKQNNYLFKLYLCLIFALLLQGCDDKEKKKLNELKTCYDDSDIHFYYPKNNLDFSFSDKYGDTKVKTIKHTIFKTKTVENLDFEQDKDYESYVIQLKKLIKLNTNDTIEITFNDNSIIKLQSFRNKPKYGGKKFLGCYSGYCLNKKDTIDMNKGHFWIQ